MVKGAAGMLRTTGAPKPAPAAAPAAADAGHGAAAKADVNVTLGDMWVKTDAPTVKAGKVTFAVKNTGATMHGFAIVTPRRRSPAGCSTRATSLAKGKELSGGAADDRLRRPQARQLRARLLLPGHYAAGPAHPVQREVAPATPLRR